jgi:multisubunit Na+/H+ antiporter MnhC subunit
MNKTYGSTDVKLEFAVNEKTSWIGYCLDLYANVTIIGNTTLTRLPYGPHNVTVYAKDMVGFEGKSEIVYFNIAQKTETQQSEPFPTTLVVGSVLIAVAVVAVATVYLLRRRKK